MKCSIPPTTLIYILIVEVSFSFSIWVLIFNLPMVEISICPLNSSFMLFFHLNNCTSRFHRILSNFRLWVSPSTHKLILWSHILAYSTGFVVDNISFIVVSISHNESSFSVRIAIIELTLKEFVIREYYAPSPLRHIVPPCPLVDEFFCCFLLRSLQLYSLVLGIIYLKFIWISLYITLFELNDSLLNKLVGYLWHIT